MNRVLKKCVDEYNSMDNIVALQRKHLTPVDYYIIGDILDDLVNKHIPSETATENPMKWCKKNGLKVVPKGIGWVISVQ